MVSDRYPAYQPQFDATQQQAYEFTDLHHHGTEGYSNRGPAGILGYVHRHRYTRELICPITSRPRQKRQLLRISTCSVYLKEVVNFEGPIVSSELSPILLSLTCTEFIESSVLLSKTANIPTSRNRHSRTISRLFSPSSWKPSEKRPRSVMKMANGVKQLMISTLQ